MAKNESYTIRLGVKGGKAVSAELVRVGKDGEGSFRKISAAGRGATRTMGDLSSLLTSRLIPALTTGFSAVKIKQYSDAFKGLEGRLKVAVGEGENLVAVQNDLFDIAQANSSPLEAVIDAYSRLSLALPDVAKQQTDLIDITDLLSQTLLISGASADGAKTFFQQFGQAASSDFKAIGQELQTFADQNSFFYKILQDEASNYGASLKDLAKDGQLSFQFIVDALNNSRGEIEKGLGNIPVTIEKSLTQLDNAFLKLIGQSQLVESGTSSIAAGITTLADNLEILSEAVTVVAIAMGGRYLTSLYLANAATGAAIIQATAFNAALIKIGATSKVVGVGATAAAVSVGALTGAMNLFLRGVALLGGPVGAALIGTIFLMRDAGEAAAQAQETLNEQMGAFQRAATKYELASDDLKVKIEEDTAARIQAYKQELIALEQLALNLENERLFGLFKTDGLRKLGSQLGIDTSSEDVRNVASSVRDAIDQLEQALNGFQESRKRNGTFVGPLLPGEQMSVNQSGNSVSDLSEKSKGVSEAEKQAKAINEVTDALKFQNAQLLRSEKEQKIYNELKKAGTSLDSEAGQKIRALVEEQFALNEALAQQVGGYEKATKALQDYAKSARDTEQQLTDMSLNALQTMEDSLVNLVKGTESVSEAFGNMADSIIEDLIRMQIRQNITAPLSEGLNSFIGGFFGGGETVGSTPSSEALLSYPKFARGGVTNRPSIFGEDGPEAAVPLPDGRSIPVDMRGGGFVNEINVINNNNSDVSVTESRGANGKNIINVVLDAVARDMTTPGGKTNRALRNMNSKRLVK